MLKNNDLDEKKICIFNRLIKISIDKKFILVSFKGRKKQSNLIISFLFQFFMAFIFYEDSISHLHYFLSPS